MTNQEIEAFFLAREIPPAIASQAAELIGAQQGEIHQAKQVYGTMKTEESLIELLNGFIALYEDDSENALENLEEVLI